MSAKFSDVLEIKNGRNQRQVENPNGQYPIYGSGGVMGYADSYLCNADTVVIGRKGSINNPIYVTEPFWNVDTAFGLEARRDKLLPKYLFYFCKRFDFEKLNTTVTIPSLTKANLLMVEMPLPGLDEQSKVVAVLDTIMTLIALRKQQIELLDLILKSQFVEMFGDPVVNPMGWNIKPLSEVITYANNGMARRGNDENGNIVLRLVELQDGYIDYAKPNRIKLDEAEKERYLLIDGDFLFARVNGNSENVGRCAVFEGIGESVYHNDHIIRVRFNHKVLDGVFASKLLNSDYGKGEMRNKIKTSAGQYTINQAGIGATKTPLPPLPLQNSFADFVRQTDKSKFVMMNTL